MELGGKSPFIIFDDADYERALDAAIFMIFSNNGQRCTAGSRIIVQSTIYEKSVADFAARAARLTIGDPLDPNTIIGPMISKDHWKKVTGYIALGQEEGATLVRRRHPRPARPPQRRQLGSTRRSSPMSITKCELLKTRSLGRCRA